MTPDDDCPADLPDPCLPATLPPVPAPRAPEPPAPSARHERLLREIEQLRERLQQWQQCESRYHERIARELQPELRRWCDRLRELALRMEGALFLAALVASCFLGAFPPVDLRAVCLVRAIFSHNL